MQTWRCDEFIERHKDANIYQEEIGGHQSFMVSDGVGLAELATSDIELLEEEPCHSKKCVHKSKHLFE
jgi:hypothetical protein